MYTNLFNNLHLYQFVNPSFHPSHDYKIATPREMNETTRQNRVLEPHGTLSQTTQEYHPSHKKRSNHGAPPWNATYTTRSIPKHDPELYTNVLAQYPSLPGSISHVFFQCPNFRDLRQPLPPTPNITQDDSQHPSTVQGDICLLSKASSKTVGHNLIKH